MGLSSTIKSEVGTMLRTKLVFSSKVPFFSFKSNEFLPHILENVPKKKEKKENKMEEVACETYNDMKKIKKIISLQNFLFTRLFKDLGYTQRRSVWGYTLAGAERSNYLCLVSNWPDNI